jgi:hypothetical protein
MNIFHGDDLAFGRFSIDLRSRVYEFNDIGTCVLRGGNIRNECEYIAGLDKTEYGTLRGDIVKKDAVTETKEVP